MKYLKGSVGPFKIYNIGKMEYAIERDNIRYATTKNINGAYRAAERLNEQFKRGDIDAALHIGNGDCK